MTTNRLLLLCCFAMAGLRSQTWPEGRVPYVITNGTASLEAALRQFTTQLAGAVEFVPRAGEPDYVNFNFDSNDHTGNCQSAVGRAAYQSHREGLDLPGPLHVAMEKVESFRIITDHF